ncbi:MAG: glycosyltransferase family 4 protein [Chthoniobacterales bacterium]
MKLAYVYAGGRLGRDAQGPSEFFYGAHELSRRSGWDVRMVELDQLPADPLTGILAGRAFRRYLPPRTSADWIARCRRALPQLRSCDVVVSTSTEASFGLCLWKSLGLLKQPLIGILCGAVNYPIGSGIRRKWTASLLARMQPVLFADSEKEELSRRFAIAPENIAVGWFGVDENFWQLPAEARTRSGVLAVGNDGRRDYATLLEAARSLPHLEFTVVTRIAAPKDSPSNVQWKRGDWHEQAVSDHELRELYQGAACVVVPLKESPQPSGQSVAMQAMMCGAPVVHTKTSGWWGADTIRDGKEVLLVPSSDPSALAEAIISGTGSGVAGRSRLELLAADWTASGFAKRIGDQAAKLVQGLGSG